MFRIYKKQVILILQVFKFRGISALLFKPIKTKNEKITFVNPYIFIIKMRKYFLLIFYFVLLLSSNRSKAQEPTYIQRTQTPRVEKSLFEIQVSPITFWIVYEHKLSESVTLRSEAGMNFGTLRAAYVPGILDVIWENWTRPSFVLEPRWYYNLYTRKKRNHQIIYNSAAFLSLHVHFRSPWVIASRFGSLTVTPEIEVVPTIGARYPMGKHFSFEYGIGVGAGYYFDDYFPVRNRIYVASNLHLRLGYRF